MRYPSPLFSACCRRNRTHGRRAALRSIVLAALAMHVRAMAKQRIVIDPALCGAGPIVAGGGGGGRGARGGGGGAVARSGRAGGGGGGRGRRWAAPPFPHPRPGDRPPLPRLRR